MKKMEFLEQLQEELSGQVSTTELREQLAFYSQYIDDETAKGISEEDVLNDLGDPWAIAHNILDDKERREGKEAAREEQAARDAAEDWRQAERDARKDREYAESQRTGGTGSYIVVLLAAILIILLIVSVVLGVLGFLARSFPLLFFVVIIGWLIHRLRN